MKAEYWNDEEIRVLEGYKYKDVIKEITDRKYDPENKAWLIPLSKENATLLHELGAELDDNLKDFFSVEIKTMSKDEKPVIPMPIKAKPYKHQIQAFNYAIKMFGLETTKGGDVKNVTKE